MRLWTACKMTLLLTLLTGIVYPLAMVGVAHLLFRFQADGSLIRGDGRVVGSELIGQNFSAPGYFHPRPSAAGDNGYDPVNSGGSNLGPTNKRLVADVRRRLAQVLEENPGVTPAQVPASFITASASGLDPDISPAAAALQIARIARARGISRQALAALVARYTQARSAGVLGEPRVNVLELNLALDRLAEAPKADMR